MQSEAGNQSQNTLPNTPSGRVLPGSVEKSLQDGDNLMDFIAKNTRGQAPVNPAAAEIQSDVNRMAEEKNKEIVITEQVVDEPVPDVTIEEPLEEPKSSEAAPKPEEEVELDEDDLELKGTTAENFKKLRTKVKELEEESTKKDEIMAELTEELEAFSSGKKLPDELVRREERIAELEHYEKLLNLKKSRYYQDEFVKPLQDINGKLEKIADDYNIDAGRLKQAANLQSEADLNRFLSNNFDPVGAGEVKKVIRDYKALQAAAQRAEKEPAEALNNLIEKANAARAEEKIQRLEVMQEITKKVWREALDDIKSEGKIRELIYKEGDVEHNAKVFTPIVRAAASEYGKLVNELARNGLETLPRNLAYALSRLCQLAHASAVAIDSRERAVAMAEQLETNTKRDQRYIRPSVSGRADSSSTSKNGTGAGGGPGSTMEAAEQLLNTIRKR